MTGRRLLAYLVLLVGCIPKSPPSQDHRVVVDLHCGLGLPVYLAVGDTFRLHAARTALDYDVLSCLDSLVPGHAWRSSAPQVISVDSQGLARALRRGVAELAAQTEFGPARGQCVALPAFARFGFGRDSIVAPIGVYTSFSVDPRDSVGVPIDAWADFRWIGGGSAALGSLIGGGGPSISLKPSHAGRAYLVGRIGIHADTVLIIAQP
jgi:hypothetical protein